MVSQMVLLLWNGDIWKSCKLNSVSDGDKRYSKALFSKGIHMKCGKTRSLRRKYHCCKTYPLIWTPLIEILKKSIAMLKDCAHFVPRIWDLDQLDQLSCFRWDVQMTLLESQWPMKQLLRSMLVNLWCCEQLLLHCSYTSVSRIFLSI